MNETKQHDLLKLDTLDNDLLLEIVYNPETSLETLYAILQIAKGRNPNGPPFIEEPSRGESVSKMSAEQMLTALRDPNLPEDMLQQINEHSKQYRKPRPDPKE